MTLGLAIDNTVFQNETHLPHSRNIFGWIAFHGYEIGQLAWANVASIAEMENLSVTACRLAQDFECSKAILMHE